MRSFLNLNQKNFRLLGKHNLSTYLIYDTFYILHSFIQCYNLQASKLISPVLFCDWHLELTTRTLFLILCTTQLNKADE